jgi:hypothetical protein
LLELSFNSVSTATLVPSTWWNSRPSNLPSICWKTAQYLPVDSMKESQSLMIWFITRESSYTIRRLMSSNMVMCSPCTNASYFVALFDTKLQYVLELISLRGDDEYLAPAPYNFSDPSNTFCSGFSRNSSSSSRTFIVCLV